MADRSVRMEGGLIRLLDQSGQREIDTISADYEDPITLETFGAHIREYQQAPPEGTKSFIIARVTTIGAGPEPKEYYYYYSASCLNRLLFYRQTAAAGQKNAVLCRAPMQNPLTNTAIVGDILYFIMKPNPLFKEADEKSRRKSKDGLGNANLSKGGKRAKGDQDSQKRSLEPPYSHNVTEASQEFGETKIELPLDFAHHKATISDTAEHKSIVARLYQKLHSIKIRPAPPSDLPQKSAECSSKLLKDRSQSLPDVSSAVGSNDPYDRSAVQTFEQSLPQSSLPRKPEACVSLTDLRSLAPNLDPSDVLHTDNTSAQELPDSEPVYEAIAFATDSSFLTSSAVRKIFADNSILNEDILLCQASPAPPNPPSDSPENNASRQEAIRSSTSNLELPANCLSALTKPPLLFYLVLFILVFTFEIWTLLPFRACSVMK